jgi:hypothetical protein
MQYRAAIRLDFNDKNTNEYQKLITALIETGWEYVETSAVAVETHDLGAILRAMVLCARQIPDSGTLTGLSFDIQGSEDFGGSAYAAAANHPNAIADINAKPLP